MTKYQNLSPWANYSVNIRFADVDCYGIVHHSAYFHYFETARLAYSRDVFDFVNEDVPNIKFPLLNCTAEFRKAIGFRTEPITVAVAFECAAETKLIFHYKLIDDESGIILARGSTTHVMLDENDRAMVQLPSQFLTRIEELQNAES